MRGPSKNLSEAASRLRRGVGAGSKYKKNADAVTLGREAGTRRWAGVSKADRRKAARAAANARWRGKGKAK